MPFIELSGLRRFLENVKQLIDDKIAGVSVPAPWRYRYDSAGDVLGLEREVDSYTVTESRLPYRITSDVELTDKANAFNDTDNTEYAVMPTSADGVCTAKILIDTQIPNGANISEMSVSFKIGTSNISSAVWTTRSYTVKCGGNVLESGDFALRTAGSVITVTISDMSVITSPIIEIEVAAQTTVEQNVRLFGAQVDATYTANRRWISMIRQNQAAWDER